MKAFFDMMDKDPHKVMILGGSCNSVTDSIAKTSKHWRIPVVSEFIQFCPPIGQGNGHVAVATAVFLPLWWIHFLWTCLFPFDLIKTLFLLFRMFDEWPPTSSVVVRRHAPHVYAQELSQLFPYRAERERVQCAACQTATGLQLDPCRHAVSKRAQIRPGKSCSSAFTLGPTQYQ